ncbi:hypothetical protein ACHIPZ_06510 [Antrihabitans sp. NCIMB 15449]|uniref:Phage shock protein B n=1 Tax=Antrihabitans spumae TaxID=3373370 RepID=A0ABW7JIS2_9NOCA
MSTLSDFGACLLLWLLLSALMFAVYVGLVVLVVDPIEVWWRRRARAKRQREQSIREIERIDRDAAVAVDRIQVAYTRAQQLLRNESRKGGRS